MPYVFPRIAGSVRFNGAVVRLGYGQVWPADDPLVKARPELFSTEPRELTTSSRPARPDDGASPDPAPKRGRRAKG